MSKQNKKAKSLPTKEKRLPKISEDSRDHLCDLLEIAQQKHREREQAEFAYQEEVARVKAETLAKIGKKGQVRYDVCRECRDLYLNATGHQCKGPE